MQASQIRIESPETARQLLDELQLIFPKATRHPDEDASAHLLTSIESPDSRSHVSWLPKSEALIAALREEDPGGGVKLAVALRPVQPPDSLDLKFANAYVRVFNEDVKAAPLLLRHGELWETLALSRVPRAIARLTAFSTTPFLSWLTTMEAATHLKYEGASFQSVVLMSKQHEWVSGPVGEGYVALQSPLSFSSALLQEKWIRAIAGSDAIGLHGLGHSGDIVGIVALPSSPSESVGSAVLPTELQPIASLVRPGTAAFVCARNGDLYVVLPNGAVFVRSHGRWQYQNFAAFQALLLQHVPQPIARPLLRLMLDLSFSRSGALFSIPAVAEGLRELVPDHAHSQRTNGALRAAISELRVDSAAHRQILLAAAAVDGAIVVSQSGVVLDVACMIGEPDSAALASAGHSKLTRFPGARSTAAWNASIFGLGIKVSEDGPISVFAKGQLVGQLG